MARPAARVEDMHICPLTTPNLHVGGPVLPLCAVNTTINGQAAARVTDHTHCNVPVMDTIRGGLLTVFIEGNPAARLCDPTDAGSITEGSATVLLGEWGGGPLTPYQAQWLYDYMSQQRNVPFEYATDGCFARADKMSSYMEALDIPVRKQWSQAVNGTMLHVDIPHYREDGHPDLINAVEWGWHVAPVVPVQPTGGGSPEQMVIDPSLGFGRPVRVDEWIAIQTTDAANVETWDTDPEVYFDRRIKMDPNDPNDTMRDPETTNEALDRYREYRENLDPSTGRNVPNAPVHY